MERTCSACGQAFVITQKDLDLLQRLAPVLAGRTHPIPPPTHCPACRQLRRLAFRNERTYYRRKCSLSGESILSMYPEDAPFPVYSAESWWSDKWDPLSYGIDAHPEEPFFSQFSALQARVPRLYFSSANSENSEYCNHCEGMKNCYLVVGSIGSEECYHGTRVFYSKNCVDCHFVDHCELCYECVNCDGCYNVTHAFQCADVHDAQWIRHCRGGSNLLFCTNLRQAQHQILNKPVDPAEFQRIRTAVREKEDVRREYEQRFQELILRSPQPATVSHLAENCTGNFISESRNCSHVFDVKELEDVSNAYDAYKLRDCMDVFSFYGPGELCYDSYSGALAINRCLFIRDCWPGDALLYCDHCFGSRDCFGCIGLRKKQYCILNKQYTKDEYESLVSQYIDAMSARGEWGEYFPMKTSPFPYNDSMANEEAPLVHEEALKRGYRWAEKHDAQLAVAREVPASELPSDIRRIDDAILDWAIRCEATGKLFKLIPQELAFYRRMQLSVPRLHPNERHRRRKLLKNPRHLWERPCANCGERMLTTYATERSETLYCEKCYLKEIS